jgi:hypothetical protein
MWKPWHGRERKPGGTSALRLTLLLLLQASRVLRPGGMLVVAFGPHCFREKALAGWLSRDMAQRSTLLQE